MVKNEKGNIMLKESLIAKTDAKADKSQIFSGFGLRITYITSHLIRVEKVECIIRVIPYGSDALTAVI